MIQRAVFFSIALSFGAALAHGAEASIPVMLGRMDDGSTLTLLSVDGAGSSRLVRTRRAYATPRGVGGASGVLAEVDWQHIDCAARTYTLEHVEWYADAQAGGQPVQQFDVQPALRQTVVARAGERNAIAVVIDAACAGAGGGGAQPGLAPGVPAYPAPQVPQLPQVAQVPVPQPVPPPPAPVPVPQQEPDPRRPAPAPPPASGPWLPPAAGPSSSGPIAQSRPFKDSVFTLGTMGRLAQYVYVDEPHRKMLAAVSTKLARARPQLAPGPFAAMVASALARNDKALARYQAASDAKERMLAAENLEEIALPALPVKQISAFRAELYRHRPSGQQILVLRGSQEALDWVSNAWIGVDLLELEAPHYQAARMVTERILQGGARPIVVGHSLGGGMAQYVGQMFKLKVVAFNSSPLPARYIPVNNTAAPENIRLFSAIEFYEQPQNTATRADPVSLRLPRLAESLAALRGTDADDGLVKAHRHLVLPVCVASRPVPFLSAEEDEQLAALINNMLNSSIIGAVATGQFRQGMKQQGVHSWIGQAVGRHFDQPPFAPVRGDADDKLASDHARRLVAGAGIAAYHTALGVEKAGSVLYNVSVGSSLKALGTMAKAAAVTGAKFQAAMLLMPHSMERFNRGMQAQVDRDVFIADAVRAQCQPPATMY